MPTPTDNVIQWRCRSCKGLHKQVIMNQGKWPLCYGCYERAYGKRKLEEALNER